MLRAIHAVVCRGLPALIALAICLACVWRVAANPEILNDLCPSGFANFGDSLTDTGNTVNLFPFAWDQEKPPYGETFFGRPAKRFCNGRLVPDFFSLAFHKPLLDPYNSVTTFQYRHGINFAASGATAAPINSDAYPVSFYPYQVAQFKRFTKSVAAVKSAPECQRLSSAPLESTRSCELALAVLPEGNADSYIGSWLYSLEAGGNDLMVAMGSFPISYMKSVPPVTGKLGATVVQEVVRALASGIEDLYKVGARRFLIYGMPALGCAPCILTQYDTLPKDTLGCVAFANRLAQDLNSELLRSIRSLRASQKESSIAFFDYYKANVEILTQPRSYGFHPQLTKVACCGASGPYNYKANVMCGHSGASRCENPEQHVNWDGIHFTDAFYRTISELALAGSHTDGGIPYKEFCSLDFSLFGPSAKYEQACPSMCETAFA